jgi:uncharacterized protein with PIN domain
LRPRVAGEAAVHGFDGVAIPVKEVNGNAPLLFKGDDLTHTDLRPALPISL